MTRIFVYGSLKRDGGNHALLTGQQFLGAARTPPGFTLYTLGDYPGMVRSDDQTHDVVGELWAVNAACLKQLDALEGVAEGLYERITLQLTSPFADQPVEAYLYLGSLAGRSLLGAEFRL